MTGLIYKYNRLNPWSILNSLNDNLMDRDNFWREDSYELRPQVEISSNDKVYSVTMDIPGVSEKDVKIELENNVLTIKGEKTATKTKDDGKLHFSERVYGSFKRSFELSDDISKDSIKAEFKDGVLKITLPRSEKLKSEVKQIAINK